MALMGVDAGITGVKAAVFNVAGEELSESYREYSLHEVDKGRAELDPRELREAVWAVISKAAGGAAEEVTALAVSSMGEAFVPTGAGGGALGGIISPPLGGIISPIDNRSAYITERLAERFGKEKLFRITGLPPHPSYTVYNVLWLKENEPEIFGAVWKFLCIQDYIGFLLTGKTVMDFSMASRTGLFDVSEAVWSEELFGELALSTEKFSEPVAPGTPVGRVNEEARLELGLADGAVLVAGGHDQPVCAVGAGAISEGVADLSLGTVECLTNTHREAHISDATIRYNFPVYFHALPGHYTSLAYNFTSGSLLRWYRDNFASEEKREAEAQGRDVYEVLFEKMPDETTDVLVAPHFVGTGTPHVDPAARGAVVNLHLSTTRVGLFLACAQGAVLELMVNYRGMAECGLAPHTINAIGGGARSRKWVQMRADALGVGINRMGVAEAGCAGAAVLAGAGTGEFASVEEGARAFARVVERMEPRRERAGRWEELYGKYHELYGALRAFRF